MNVMLSDWRNILAAAALVACLLPFVSIALVSANLFGTVSWAGTLSDSLSQMLQQFHQAQAAQAPELTQYTMQIWALRSAYLLLAIPLMAALTLGAALTGRNNTRPAFALGVLCLLLPVLAICGEFALSSARSHMPMGMGAFVLGVMSMIGMGFYAISTVRTAPPRGSAPLVTNRAWIDTDRAEEYGASSRSTAAQRGETGAARML
jgi:hypothetical protein